MPFMVAAIRNMHTRDLLSTTPMNYIILTKVKWRENVLLKDDSHINYCSFFNYDCSNFNDYSKFLKSWPIPTSYLQIPWIHCVNPSCLEFSSGPRQSGPECTLARRSPSVCRHQQGGCNLHSSPQCDQIGMRCPYQSCTPTMGKQGRLQPYSHIETHKASEFYTHTHLFFLLRNTTFCLQSQGLYY